MPNCKVCTLFQPAKLDEADKHTVADHSAIVAKITAKAHEMKVYAASHKLNTHFGFLVNMGQPSGQNRFYVYDLQKNLIVNRGLVAHGSGNLVFAERSSFSNTYNSKLSSLGKYKVGAKYIDQFGTAYKLHGRELTNNNAFSRAVVLHSYSCVPSAETYPKPICNSLV